MIDIDRNSKFLRVVIKYHKWGALKQHKLIFSQLGRLKIPNRGVGRATGSFLSSSRLPVAVSIFGLPWLAAASLQSQPLPPHGVHTVCLFAVSSLFYKNTSHIGLRAAYSSMTTS